MSTSRCLVLGALLTVSAGLPRLPALEITLPPETARFAESPLPGFAVTTTLCSTCHSADYVKTQPLNVKSKKDFWQAEVTKMVKAYGAPIDDADVPKIVEYLAATY